MRVFLAFLFTPFIASIFAVLFQYLAISGLFLFETSSASFVIFIVLREALLSISPFIYAFEIILFLPLYAYLSKKNLISKLSIIASAVATSLVVGVVLYFAISKGAIGLGFIAVYGLIGLSFGIVFSFIHGKASNKNLRFDYFKKQLHRTAVIKITIITFFLMILFTFSFGFYALNHHSVEADKAARALTSKIANFLVSEGVCKARNNCGGKEFVFRSHASDTIYIEFFRSNDVKPAVISEIIDLCTEAYYQHDKKMTVNLVVYTETIRERNAWFSGVKPFIHLTLKGEK